ncbi:apelin receptor A isoform X2 [Nematostella vectensis]|uniref:apelin receptor A isoform X2 n=1 Tax=Nematostella vectensis TaxID=45351 RepID=UPI0013905F5E|nr:apelin receptor A isoform X2 [Nematostella vectensis]
MSGRETEMFLIIATFIVGIEVIAGESNWTRCSPVCKCAHIDKSMAAVCRPAGLLEPDHFALPVAVESLSIENDSLDFIPAGLFSHITSLKQLILKNNSIRSIAKGAFNGLDKLLTLDLSSNGLQIWDVDPDLELNSLKTVKLYGNRNYSPDTSILKLCNLRELQGVSWSMHCKDCTLAKFTEDARNMTRIKNMTDDDMGDAICVMEKDEFLHNDVIKYGKTFEYVKLGFTPQCICEGDEECYNHEIQFPYFEHLYEVPRSLFHIQYGIGSIILVLNIVIVILIIFCPSLRNSTSFILICSMALSDALVGVYTIMIAIHNPFHDTTVTPNELLMNNIKVCPNIGVVFTTAQVTTVFTSFFLTLERYLAIVHCDNPTARLSSKLSLRLSILVWLIAITFAMLPIFGVQGLQYHKWFQCTMPFHKGSYITDTSTVTLAVGVLCVMIYLTSVGLYVRIYVFVQKASSQLGVKREARLAKRISLMVLTNFFFFVTPMILFLIYVYRFVDLMLDAAVTLNSLRAFFVMGSWIPVTLLGLSSLINPFLYAFRHQKFQREATRLGRNISCNIGMSVNSQNSDRKGSTRQSNKTPTWKKHQGSNGRRLKRNGNPNTIELQLFSEPEHHEPQTLDP